MLLLRMPVGSRLSLPPSTRKLNSHASALIQPIPSVSARPWMHGAPRDRAWAGCSNRNSPPRSR
eukprot:5899556-Pyramimonas_sp.AAC.1